MVEGDLAAAERRGCRAGGGQLRQRLERPCHGEVQPPLRVEGRLLEARAHAVDRVDHATDGGVAGGVGSELHGGEEARAAVVSELTRRRGGRSGDGAARAQRDAQRLVTVGVRLGLG